MGMFDKMKEAKNMYSNIRPHILNTIHKSSLVFKDLLKNNGMFKNNLK